MKQYNANNIKNIAIVGHGGSGKRRWQKRCCIPQARLIGWGPLRTGQQYAITTRKKLSARLPFLWRLLLLNIKVVKLICWMHRDYLTL